MIYVRGRGGLGKGKGEKGRDVERGFIIIGAGMKEREGEGELHGSGCSAGKNNNERCTTGAG